MPDHTVASIIQLYDQREPDIVVPRLESVQFLFVRIALQFMEMGELNTGRVLFIADKLIGTRNNKACPSCRLLNFSRKPKDEQ